MAGSGGSGGGSIGGGGGFGGGGFSGGFRHTSFINSPRYSSGDGNNSGGSGPETPIYKIGLYIIIGILALSAFSITDVVIEDDDYFFEDLYEDVVSVSPYEDDPENYIITEKLPLGTEYCNPMGVYVTDATEDGEFGRIDGPLEKTLIKFYKKTGIEPHVYFFDYPFDDILYETALDLYYELFEDEGHLLLALACDSYDYEYEIIIGDDTREILDENALTYLNDNINDGMLSADYGAYDSIMENLCTALSMTAEKIMYEYTYVGEIFEEDFSIPDDEPVSDIPATTEKDVLEEFIENEFGSHETTDKLDEIFAKIESSMEKVSVSGVLTIIVILLVFGAAIVAVIVISKKRNNYDPDTFGKEDGKYDNFLK